MRKLTLAELFKARDALIVLRDLGFWVEPELSEVTEAIYEYQKKNMVEGNHA